MEGLPIRGRSFGDQGNSGRAHTCQDVSVQTLCCQSSGQGSVQRRDSEVRVRNAYSHTHLVFDACPGHTCFTIQLLMPHYNFHTMKPIFYVEHAVICVKLSFFFPAPFCVIDLVTLPYTNWEWINWNLSAIERHSVCTPTRFNLCI